MPHNGEEKEIPVVPFESLPPYVKEPLLEELQKKGFRPATLEEQEVVKRMKKTGYLIFKEGEWQLVKPAEKESNKRQGE